MPKIIERPINVNEYKALKKALGTKRFDSIIENMERSKKKNIEEIFMKKNRKK